MDGMIQEFNENGELDYVSRFAKTQIHVERSVESFYTRKKTAKEMDSAELKEKIKILDKGGINTRILKTEYYMKRSRPVACLIFGILGMAFCMHFVKSGKDWWGVITAIILVVLLVGFYMFMMAVFRSFAKKGIVTPFWGAWLPNIIYGVPGVGLILYDCYRK